jgi:hypothetical protein
LPAIRILISRHALEKLQNIPKSKTSEQVLPSYSRALINFLKTLQKGKWIKDKELLSNLEIWKLGTESTRFTCEVGKDLTIAWELVYTVDIRKMIEVRYSEGKLDEKVMGAHAIIHHIGPFTGIPQKVLNLGEENFMIDNNANIDVNSLNEIVYDSEFSRSHSFYN